MGFNNPIVPWREIERALSDRPRPSDRRNRGNYYSHAPDGANGGDSPAWSPRRAVYEPPVRLERRASATPYAELHCHSSFSFLDGASQPEELAEEAVRAGLEALALTDHDGFYGVVRFSEAAKAVGLPTVFGSELSLGPTALENGMGSPAAPRQGEADPEGIHLVVLARNPRGYGSLSSTISLGQMAGVEKGKPDYASVDWSGTHGGDWLVLTGCRKGPLARALLAEGPAAAGYRLDRLIEVFGRDNVAVELWDHGDPLDAVRNDGLAALAVGRGVAVVATGNV
ncbi:MAG TPA: PHP domain-containing protein, partial [Acidimicrobiales bacterium]|nr:PHP domain-containing protein [Acidimicrobiales bacterium]